MPQILRGPYFQLMRVRNPFRNFKKNLNINYYFTKRNPQIRS